MSGYVKDPTAKVRHLAARRGDPRRHRPPHRRRLLPPDAHFGVEEAAHALAGLKRTENEARLVREYDEVFEVLLLPAFLLLVLEACLSERRRLRKEASA